VAGWNRDPQSTPIAPRAAARNKANYLQAQFHRRRARRRAKKGNRRALRIIYHMLIGGELLREILASAEGFGGRKAHGAMGERAALGFLHK
jgi:hypothetical protein